MGKVELEQVTKVYPNGMAAVHELDLDIADGEFMVLVGPSGSGKTTVLRMVAGLEDITSGTVRIGDRVVNNLTPRERDLAMVFQNYALYPHMTVAENIAFALALRKLPKEEVNQKVQDAAQMLGLSEYLKRKPAQLSGGQRQRVAMGRAIVRQPAAFLMDEPLSNLDAKLRVQMRAEIMRVQRRIGVATMYVTHDQTEAMTMGDRVAVLSDGRLQQVDAPQALYDTPVNTFVAAFIGSPAMNMYRASVDEHGTSVRLGEQVLSLPAGLRANDVIGSYRGKEVIVGIRPEHLRDPALLAEEPDAQTVLGGDVDLIESLGSEKLVHFRIDAPRHRVEQAMELGAAELGEPADAGELPAASSTESVARVEPASQIAQGRQVTFAVLIDRLQLFDADTGEAIRSRAQPTEPVSSEAAAERTAAG